MPSTTPIKTSTTICYDILTEVKKISGDLDGYSIVLRVNPEIARALKDEGRSLFRELEATVGRPVTIRPDEQLHHEQAHQAAEHRDRQRMQELQPRAGAEHGRGHQHAGSRQRGLQGGKLRAEVRGNALLNFPLDLLTSSAFDGGSGGIFAGGYESCAGLWLDAVNKLAEDGF